MSTDRFEVIYPDDAGDAVIYVLKRQWPVPMPLPKPPPITGEEAA